MPMKVRGKAWMPSMDWRLNQSSKSCFQYPGGAWSGSSELGSEISSGFTFPGYNYFTYPRMGGRVEGETETSRRCHRGQDLVNQLVKLLSPYEGK